MGQNIGVLTAGGDSPGLNAAIRALGKTAASRSDTQLIGFRDGFRGLMENRSVRLDEDALSGILARGGTILGTSRDKPHRMPVGSRVLDMTDVMVENCRKHRLRALVCLGGGGTQKNAWRLAQKGLAVLTLPKTIDNDVAMTDVTFGFDTALGIATDAIDRLHSTAHSHHRIIVVEVMGNNAGWLALGAGIAGGADVILIPEIPYRVDRVAEAIRWRSGEGKNFSIVAIAEGARSVDEAKRFDKARQIKRSGSGAQRREAIERIQALERAHRGHTLRLANQLEALTGLETRMTILGHLQRGGTPSAADRLLATRLGSAAAAYVEAGRFGVMVAARGARTEPVPLADVVGKRRTVPPDHPWVCTARDVGTCFGD